MVRTLHGIYDGQSIRLEEPIDLAPETRLMVTIATEDDTAEEPYSFLRVAESLKLTGPSDWSERFEEYLYGGAAKEKPRE